jgi:transketolase
VSGSADLTGNTGTKVASFLGQSAQNHDGRQMYYGIREHGMGSAMVGMALHGGVIPVGGTFFVFVDYMRPPVRLAALSGARVVFVFTHDSVAVGEDGPTHQPVEQLAGLRSMPGLHVLRPADANETSRAWEDAVTHDGPTAMILSRQDVRVVTDGSAITAGAGVVGDDTNDPDVILIGTGSEVSLCVDAADTLRASGRSVRVVSMPSWDRFRSQTVTARNSILTPGVPIVSVEAGSTFGWHEWSDRQVGIDRFGASAPGDVALDRLGINVDAIVATVDDMLGGGA